MYLFGTHRAKGYFKDSDVGANCVVLLTVVLWYAGGALIPFLWPKRFRSPEGPFR